MGQKVNSLIKSEDTEDRKIGVLLFDTECYHFNIKVIEENNNNINNTLKDNTKEINNIKIDNTKAINNNNSNLFSVDPLSLKDSIISTNVQQKQIKKKKKKVLALIPLL